MSRFILPALAILGIGAAIVAITIDNRAQTAAEPMVVPGAPPYSAYVAGAGMIEASTGNISIGSPVAGIATDVFVDPGDAVAAGDALFRVDVRNLEADRAKALSEVAVAKAALQAPQHRLSFSEELAARDSSSVSADTLTALRDSVDAAEAGLALAEAEVARLDTEIDRHTVRAPVAGRVLQLNLRVGERVDGRSVPLIVFGDDRTLFVRAYIDESDAWRVRPGAEATGFVRGDPSLTIPLEFEYVEPHVVPKTSLTGRSTERTDTRVLQVVFRFDHGTLPVYVGQQLDVFIAAPPAESGGAAARQN